MGEFANKHVAVSPQLLLDIRRFAMTAELDLYKNQSDRFPTPGDIGKFAEKIEEHLLRDA